MSHVIKLVTKVHVIHVLQHSNKTVIQVYGVLHHFHSKTTDVTYLFQSSWYVHENNMLYSTVDCVCVITMNLHTMFEVHCITFVTILYYNKNNKKHFQ